MAGLVLRLLETGGVVTGEGYVIPGRYTHRGPGAIIGVVRP